MLQASPSLVEVRRLVWDSCRGPEHLGLSGIQIELSGRNIVDEEADWAADTVNDPYEHPVW